MPIAGASIRVGQEEASTLEDGSFELQLPEEPRPEMLVRVSHDDYVTRFFRLDDSIFTVGHEVELVPKMRIIVPDFEGTVSALDRALIRGSMEKGLTACSHITLLAEKEREQIIKELRQNQEERPLYDEKTLVKVGNFLGATHGVFGNIMRSDGAFALDAKLISFKTRKQETASDLRFTSANLLDIASEYSANQLLAQLTDIKILTPKTGTRTRRRLAMAGYAVFRPEKWDLWISVVPVGISVHFPQDAVTMKGDESWVASSVTIGPESTSEPTDFNVYALITAPEYTKEIRSYIDNHKSAGLDINSWDKRKCRIVDNVLVTRIDAEK